ncbi:TPA: ankyrin repeat domain-containing protein [Stenotrophomonas maltophilia]|nr:ankyrin repeat domain-containing protein [Stenotrophomonas maltophilia]
MSHLLAKAAEQQDLERIDALMDAGADIEWRHKGTGRTPLLSAVIAGKVESVVRLLDRGANMEQACAAVGFTALGWAAERNDAAMGRLLIARGASLDAASPELRRTPLMAAAQGGHLSMVELLLDSGADVACLDFEGRNALALAEDRGHTAVVQRLRTAGAQTPPALVEAPPLAWPEPAAEGDPAAVVRGYVLACHAWETRGYRDAKAGGDLLGTAAFQQERADILAAWCTGRKRVYSTGMSVGNPPLHMPEDLLVALVQPTASKAEVLVRDSAQKSRGLRYERLFMLKRVAGQWRIDTLKKRPFRTDTWAPAIL